MYLRNIFLSLFRRVHVKKCRCILLVSLFLIMITCFALFIYALYFEPAALQVVYYDVISSDLPEDFQNVNIMLVSDIHYGAAYTWDLREKLIALIQKENPDLILFAGDYSDHGQENLHRLCKSLNSLDAPLGKFGVPGNHDYIPTVEKTLDVLHTDAHITSLADRGVWLTRGKGRIRLIGTEFHWNPNFPLQFPYYEMTRQNEDDFIILLTHSPDVYERFALQEKKKIDLVLSGHSHGGQVTFFGYFTPISVIQHRKYLSGKVLIKHKNVVESHDVMESDVLRERSRQNSGNTSEKETCVITSNGVGTTGIPLRFFAPPDIVKITLKRPAHPERSK